MLLNYTQIILQCLREGKLNNLVNQHQTLINTVNKLYFASVYKFYMIYKANKMTIRNYGKLKADLTESIKKNPSKVLKDFAEELDYFNKS